MQAPGVEPQSTLPSDSLVPLEAVLCTEELNQRPAREPDYERENRALISLAQALADSPRTILQTLADTILDVFQADSAGISLLTKEDGGKRFYWPAIAGVWNPHIGGGTPRDFGPCGDVLDRNAPLLFRHFERRYAYFLPVIPPVEECLLVPFYVEGKAVGTIWAIAHDERRKFDMEDLRQLESLARFASAAYQAVEFLGLLEQREDALHHSNAELAQRMAELQKVSVRARESRRAALNLMEDADHATEVVGQRTAQYETLLNQAPLGVFLVDGNLRIRQVNPIAQPVFEDIPDLIGRHLEELMHLLWTREYADEIVRVFRHTLDTGESYQSSERSEYRIDRGVTEHYEWRTDRIALPEGGYGVVCYFRDISAQVFARAAVAESQEHLRQAAKMEAIGRLAGGLAHDFNNQLHALSGFADFVVRDPGLGARSRHDLLEIQKAAERMASLTRQLLAYSRQQVLLPETLDLNVAVRDGQTMLQRLIGSDIQMLLRLSPTAAWVRVDRGQLLQVLMNLAINARDSMAQGGELILETSTETVGREELYDVAGAPVDPGQYVRLVVADSGTGIAPEHLQHLFEPFFTTKEVGKGTGLGLATVQGVVMQSQGHVWAENAPGGGAIFTVLLPLASEPAPARSRPARRSGPTVRHGKLLLVEDEDVLRSVVARTLEDSGFVVLQATHGGEALHQLERVAGAVDLVISDVVMPVLGGRELSERLAADYPDLPVIWISGYPRDVAFGSGVSSEHQPFLQKPVTSELLVETVRQVLESRVGAAPS